MWRYLEHGSQPPSEYRMLRYIDRFGTQAVTRRDYLGTGEMRRMLYCENLEIIYEAVKRAANIVTWQREHPDEYRMYIDALQAADNG